MNPHVLYRKLADKKKELTDAGLLAENIAHRPAIFKEIAGIDHALNLVREEIARELMHGPIEVDEEGLRSCQLAIREISDKRIEELLEFMTIVHYRDGEYREAVLPENYRTVSYTWDVKTKGPALSLEKVGWVWGYHTWASPSLFKPTVAEVLSAIDGTTPMVATHVCLQFDPTAEYQHKPDLRSKSGHHRSRIYLLKRAS